MRVRFLLLAACSLMLVGCAQMRTEAAQFHPNSWKNGEKIVVSQGGAVVLGTDHEDVVVILDAREHPATHDVVVLALQTASGFLIETSDPAGRYLPTVSFTQRNNTPVLRVDAHQVSLENGSIHRYIGEQDYHSLHAASLGESRVSELHTFLTDALSLGSLNIIYPAGQTLNPETRVDVIQTPGSMTVMLIPLKTQTSESGFLLSADEDQPVAWEVVSTTLEQLATYGLTNLCRH